MLQDVSAGTRDKFEILGCQRRHASRRPKTKNSEPNTNGIVKARRTKSTKTRDNWPSQHKANSTRSSPPATAGDDATDAMLLVSTDDDPFSVADGYLEYGCRHVLKKQPC